MLFKNCSNVNIMLDAQADSEFKKRIMLINITKMPIILYIYKIAEILQ